MYQLAGRSAHDVTPAADVPTPRTDRNSQTAHEQLLEKARKGRIDVLHLDVKGYQVWADALRPILTRLLGPPAKEDHAPPPTGDPSAANRPA